MNTEPSTDRQRLESVYRSVMDAVSSDDGRAIDELMADDLIDHNAIPGQVPGRDGFKQWMASARVAFPDLEATVEEVLVDGERLAGRVVYRGTHRGPFLGIAGTGKAVSMAAFHVVRFDDQRIVEWWGVADMVGVLFQMGGGISQPKL